MIEKNITTLSALIDYVSAFDDMCYRGQGDSRWTLIPTSFRNMIGLSPSITDLEIQEICELERDIYREFSQKSRPQTSLHPNVDWKNDWELLCLAQHYDTPTRLLDWTTNPQVAAYFAVSGSNVSNGVIWCLDISLLPIPPYEIVGRRTKGKGYPTSRLPRNGVSFFEDYSKSIVGPKFESFFAIVQPPTLDKRIENQQGIFSVFVSSTDPTSSDSFMWDYLDYIVEIENTSKHTILHKLVVPAASRSSFEADLVRVGLTPNFIYPDLIGLGQHLRNERDKGFKSRILDYR